MKSDPIGMDCLFDEAEYISEKESDDSKEDKSDSPKRRGKRKPLPNSLERERQEFDLSDEEKKCSIHGVRLVKIGEEISEKLDIIPASIKVLQEVIFKYKCPCCSKENDKDVIITSNKDLSPIPKSIASAGLLAHIAISKFEDSFTPIQAGENL